MSEKRQFPEGTLAGDMEDFKNACRELGLSVGDSPVTAPPPDKRDDYPPGTFGRAYDDFDAAVERLPWHFRWFWRRRAVKARRHFEGVRDRSLAQVIRQMWAEEQRCEGKVSARIDPAEVTSPWLREHLGLDKP